MTGTSTKSRAMEMTYPLALGLLAAGSAMVLMVQAALAQTAEEMTADQAMLDVAEAPEYGEYITDAEGRPVYMFMADRKGKSNCHDECAEAWPPLLTGGEPTAGPQAHKDLLGTIQREDGSTQVTYNGWPLYYFVKDEGGNRPTGQDVVGFGDEWYLVSPGGEPVHEKGREGKTEP